jgi:hypothetical protein
LLANTCRGNKREEQTQRERKKRVKHRCTQGDKKRQTERKENIIDNETSERDIQRNT